MGDEHVSGEQEGARSDRGMDNPSPLWPLDKLTPAPDGKEGCILLTTGAMNPCHLGHVAMLHAAATRVQRAGYHVCGAFLSPSHDLYVRPKAEALGTMWLSAAFRLAVARCATSSDPLVSVSAWEAEWPGSHWPDFPVVCNAAATDSSLSQYGRVFYVCGSDHARKCGLERGERQFGVVIVPRADDRVVREAPGQRNILVAAPLPDEAASFSSTALRAALAVRDEAKVRAMASPAVAALLLHPSSEKRAAFESDYRTLSSTTVLRSKRKLAR